MAFVECTSIFTNTGWKNIENISGHDKVLVRNFIGEAEFIQPFALKRRQYNGEVITIGGRNWGFTVTPAHRVVYGREMSSGATKFLYDRADNIKINKKNRIYRKFRYISQNEYKKETLCISTSIGKRFTTISNYDWFVLVGYVICRGYFDNSNTKRHVLTIRLDNDSIEYETNLLGDILDRIGVEWSVIPSRSAGTYTIYVGAKSNLPSRLITRLGSSKRKEMFIPDKMIYNGSKEMASKLIETIINATKRPSTEYKGVYQFISNNEKLINSLVMLGTIWGYGMHVSILAKKGTNTGKGILRKDVLNLSICGKTGSYSPTKIEKNIYDGHVYEIDLFDGQVYVKKENMPVWVNPK